jgi:hypothetical protein
VSWIAVDVQGLERPDPFFKADYNNGQGGVQWDVNGNGITRSDDGAERQYNACKLG